MTKPLLTIAIPTWNRASLLGEALNALLTQIDNNPNKDKIEIVISDNASTDKTNAIIKTYKSKYNTLNIVHFEQKENTGYFGNFQKCRELSKASYFWLLSDNDHLAKGVIAFILDVLIKKNPSFVFLSDWSHTEKMKNDSNFVLKEYGVEQALESFHYRTTLISAVIFLNKKDNDQELFDNFRGNTFIGFMYFLQSLDYNRCVVELKGTSLYIKDTKVSFNAFKSFSVDLVICMDHAVNHGILSEEVAKSFMNKVISELTVRHYILYRITHKLHGMNPGSREEVDVMLTKGFKKYLAYQELLKPLLISKGVSFYLLVITKYSKRLLEQQFDKYSKQITF